MLPTEEYGFMRRVKDVIVPELTAAETGFTGRWGKLASRSLPPGMLKSLSVKQMTTSATSKLFEKVLAQSPILIHIDEAEKLLTRDIPKPKPRITYPHNKWFRIMGLSPR
ncbi:MAG: hypothetical protein CMA05_04750 [Euryarchaeota archaeon]|nr:hypothetical protein [Euryarchaeota archaeon]|tara:strand:- start:153 stop:482 length:330 start_codon:yes stop_codon:yes gene_type:complete